MFIYMDKHVNFILCTFDMIAYIFLFQFFSESRHNIEDNIYSNKWIGKIADGFHNHSSPSF